MPKKKWSVVKDFDFVKLKKEWSIDLIEYINTATLLNWLPKAIKRIVVWLIHMNEYKVVWTNLVRSLTSNEEDMSESWPTVDAWSTTTNPTAAAELDATTPTVPADYSPEAPVEGVEEPTAEDSPVEAEESPAAEEEKPAE